MARIQGTHELNIMKKLCALVVGHKRTSPGAMNKNTGLTEFEFNDNLAKLITPEVRHARIHRVYRKKYIDLPGQINELNPQLIVSLHCNAFNGKTSGSEVLYYHRSEKGQKAAQILLDRLVETLELKDRGELPRTAEDRGGYLLKYTKAPCIIGEPFFIDNDSDLLIAQSNLDKLVEAYAKAIDEIIAGVITGGGKSA